MDGEPIFVYRQILLFAGRERNIWREATQKRGRAGVLDRSRLFSKKADITI